MVHVEQTEKKNLKTMNREENRGRIGDVNFSNANPDG